MRSIWLHRRTALRVSLIIFLLLGTIFLSPLSALAAEARGVIVKYKSGRMPAVAEQATSARERHLAAARMVLVRKGAAEDVEALVARFRRDERVEFVEPDYLRRAVAVYPSDPLFNQQWELTRLDLPLAWEVTKGSRDTVVAVVDSGVDLRHEELAGRLLPGYDFVNNGYLLHYGIR